MYLDQHSNSTDQYSKAFDEHYQRNHLNEEDDDEDLSMVSDASSGPPQFHKYEIRDEKKKKNKIKEQKVEEKNLYLDDTASSPLCHFSQDILASTSTHISMEHIPGFSQALPPAQFQKHFGFFKSSQNEKTASAKSGGLLGRKRP
ncbi:Uncharacterized protein Adt_39691 [Abeliophyllum distichum]|uniref:Uncharacterized protein n=1 Tax=Abeliophyllum distichum TaxID=126358 RepID=A0ABD1Q5T8_9LAMI